MKKLIAILAALLILSASLGALAVPMTQTDTLGPFTFSVPDEWTFNRHDDEDVPYINYISPSGDDMLTFELKTIQNPPTNKFTLGVFYARAIADLGYDDVDKSVVTTKDGGDAMMWRSISPNSEGSYMIVSGLVCLRDNSLITVTYICVGATPEAPNVFFATLIRSIVYEEPAADEPSADEPAPASADADLSAMSFDELLALRQRVDEALWNSDGWQEVNVPHGDYCVGEDIPAGKWSITLTTDDPDAFGEIRVFASEADYTSAPLYGFMRDELIQPGQTLNLSLSENNYVVIMWYDVTFHPYTGAALGFR